jgi:hypothetical protein
MIFIIEVDPFVGGLVIDLWWVDRLESLLTQID